MASKSFHYEQDDSKSVAAIQLMSPFLSIRTLARDLILQTISTPEAQSDNQHNEHLRENYSEHSWWSKSCSNFMSYFIRERLDSSLAIQMIQCPCLIIHGLRDTLVPFWHAKELQELSGK